MCITDHHDMTLAIKVASNRNTTNQHSLYQHLSSWAATIAHSPLRHFETIPNLKKLPTTTQMWLLKDFNSLTDDKF